MRALHVQHRGDDLTLVHPSINDIHLGNVYFVIRDAKSQVLGLNEEHVVETFHLTYMQLSMIFQEPVIQLRLLDAHPNGQLSQCDSAVWDDVWQSLGRPLLEILCTIAHFGPN